MNNDILKGINPNFLSQNILNTYNNQALLLNFFDELVSKKDDKFSQDNEKLRNELNNIKAENNQLKQQQEIFMKFVENKIYEYCFKKAIYNTGMKAGFNDKILENESMQINQDIYLENNNFNVQNIYKDFRTYLYNLKLFIIHNIDNIDLMISNLQLRFNTVLLHYVIGYYCFMWLFLGIKDKNMNISEKIFNINNNTYNELKNDKRFDDNQTRMYLLSFIYSPFDYITIYNYCSEMNKIKFAAEDIGSIGNVPFKKILTSLIIGSYLYEYIKENENRIYNLIKNENENNDKTKQQSCFFYYTPLSKFLYLSGFMFLTPYKLIKKSIQDYVETKFAQTDTEMMNEESDINNNDPGVYGDNVPSYIRRILNFELPPIIKLIYVYILINSYLYGSKDNLDKYAKNLHNKYNEKQFILYKENCINYSIFPSIVDKNNNVNLTMGHLETIDNSNISFKFFNVIFNYLIYNGLVKKDKKGLISFEGHRKTFISILNKYYSKNEFLSNQIKKLMSLSNK